jgi:hypothetical protein
MKAKIRKIAVTVEETHLEMGRAIEPPTRKAVAVAVIENPFANRYQEDLSELMEIGAELGGYLGGKCVEALGIAPAEAESYGKSAMVGETANWNTRRPSCIRNWARRCARPWKRGPRWCRPPRRWAARARCSTCLWATRTRPTCAAISTGSRFSLNDAPRANEIMVAVAVTDSGRPLPRVGGLEAADAKGEDGLR